MRVVGIDDYPDWSNVPVGPDEYVFVYGGRAWYDGSGGTHSTLVEVPSWSSFPNGMHFPASTL